MIKTDLVTKEVNFLEPFTLDVVQGKSLVPT